MEPDFVILITQWCVILHNCVRERDDYKFTDSTIIMSLEDVEGQPTVRTGRQDFRKRLAEYLLLMEHLNGKCQKYDFIHYYVHNSGCCICC